MTDALDSANSGRDESRPFALPTGPKGHQIRRLGVPRPAGAALFVWQDVLAELCMAAQRRQDTFQTAILLGSVREAAAGTGVLVQGYAEMSTWRDEMTFLHETLDDWSMLVNRARRGIAPLRPVGWVSMVSGAQGQIRPLDEFLHRSLFNLPFQVLLSLDGQNDRCAAWATDAQGYLVNIGFNLVMPNSGDARLAGAAQ
jgi:hypothetical protein